MSETAVIVGVVPGLGLALVNAFPHEGYTMLAAARKAAKVGALRGIAEAYVALHRQHRSAWTQELDLRPWSEKF